MEKISSEKLKYAGVAFVLLAIILIILFLLNGETIVSGGFPDDVSDEGLSCSSDIIKYDLFDNDGAISNQMQISAIFSGDKLKSINIAYTAKYRSNQLAEIALTHTKVNMNDSFGVDLGADALGVTYSTWETEAKLNMFADVNDVTDRTKRYFMINGSPKSFSEYEQQYVLQGFKCVKNNNKTNKE